MNAFASALAAAHADANFGTPADFRHPPGPWVPARVVLSRPSDIIGGLGGLGARTGSLAASVLAADIAPLRPRRGDELLFDGTVHPIEDAEPDALGLSWRLTLSDRLTNAAPDPVIGAIRYDAWDAPASGLTQAEQAALSQADFVHRAPFWTSVPGDAVTLPAATQQRMDEEIAQAAAAGRPEALRRSWRCTAVPTHGSRG